MNGLIYEISAYLGIAAFIGFITGWLAQSARQRASAPAGGGGSSADYEALAEQLRNQEQESKESIGRISSEIEQLRTLLGSLSEDVAESATDEGSDPPARERAEQTARELDQIQDKFDELAREHDRLQKNHDEVSGRVVEYEKQRHDAEPKPRAPRTIVKSVSDVDFDHPMSGAFDPEADSAGASTAKPIPSPVRRDSYPSPKKDLLFDHLPRFDQPGAAPVITGVVDLDELDDFIASERAAEPPVADEPPRDDAETEFPPRELRRKGTVQRLRLIAEIPGEDVARLEVLGLKTNLDLLRKCAPRGGVNALSTSMGLDSARLGRWLSAADLLRLESLPHRLLTALLDAGIDSVQALAATSADGLVAELGESAPEHADDVSKWIEEARSIADIAYS